MAPPSTPAPSRFLLPRRQGQGQGGTPGTGVNPGASQFGATPRFAVSSAAAPAATPSSSRNPPQFFTPAAPPSSRRQPLHELIDSSPASPQDDEAGEADRREHSDRFASRTSNRRSAAAHLIVEDFDDEESHSEQGGGREDDRYSSQLDSSSDDDGIFRPPPKRRRITVSAESPPLSVRVKVEEDDIMATSDLSGVMDSASDHHEPSDSYPHDGVVHDGIDHIMHSPPDPDGESDYRSEQEDDKALVEDQDEEDSDLDLFQRERQQRVPTTPSKKKDPTFHRAPRFVAAEQPVDGGPGRPQLQVPADAFSPKRRRGGARGAEYVPGGLAAEVRGWLLQVAPRVGEDGPGAAAPVAIASVPGTVHIAIVEATGSRGMWMLRARRALGDGGYGGGDEGDGADGLVKIILSGDGRTSGLDARNRVARGAIVAAHPPTWEVEIQGQGIWTMVCDWSIVGSPG
ncbi:hypothetical protein RB597_003617 [Gaeumannomyces tritici]